MITTTVPPEGRQRLANQPVVVTKSPLEQFEALEAQVQPVPVTNETLLEMMRAKKLIPGQMYRITDFITHGDAFAAADQEQPLDILVMATGETTLSESALAMEHDGDTHFNAANVQGWQLGFTPTINTARFPDADPLWKGLVYYVKYADGTEKAVEGYEVGGPYVSYEAQTLTDAQKQQARENIGASGASDLSAKEDKVTIESATGETLMAEVGKYYTLADVGTLAITLPTIAAGTTNVQTVAFYIAAGATPAVTFTSTHTVIKPKDFEIEANGLYEISAAWNGIGWIIGLLTLEIPT